MSADQLRADVLALGQLDGGGKAMLVELRPVGSDGSRRAGTGSIVDAKNSVVLRCWSDRGDAPVCGGAADDSLCSLEEAKEETIAELERLVREAAVGAAGHG